MLRVVHLLCLLLAGAAAIDVSQRTKLETIKVQDILDALPRRLESTNDLYFHAEQNYPTTDNNFWVFGRDGVFIYTNQGEEVKRMTYYEICKPNSYIWRGEWYTYHGCDFYSAATDGSQYIFVAKDENGGKIAVFSYSGLYLGQYETCRWPVGVDYAPHRNEVWVHCFSPVEEDGGHVDVMSVGAWGLNHPAIPLPNQTLGGHTHGWIELDAVTPDYAWATTREHPYIARINVHSHEVTTFDTWSSGCGALNLMAISWRNKHLYTKCHVCCTCGLFDGADVQEECWPGYAVNFTRADGTSGFGYCGIGCDGSPADTVGLLEFDTVTNKVIATHYWPEFGSGDPYSSPDGQFITMSSPKNDRVKVLHVGKNGEPTDQNAAFDVFTGFSEGAHRDTLWVHNDHYDLALFGSNDENYLVVAEVTPFRTGQGGSVSTPETITLSDKTESTAVSGRWGSRSMAWADGTDYVMTCAQGAQELYLVNLKTRQVDKTIPNVNNTFVIHVHHLEETAESMNGDDGDDGKDRGRILGIVALVVSVCCLILTFLLLAVVVTKLNKIENFAKETTFGTVHDSTEMKSEKQVA